MDKALQTMIDNMPEKTGKSLEEWRKIGYDRGAVNVRLATAPDHTGRMRPEDKEQLRRLGELLRTGGLSSFSLRW